MAAENKRDGYYRTNENCSPARQIISLRRTGIISFIVLEVGGEALPLGYFLFVGSELELRKSIANPSMATHPSSCRFWYVTFCACIGFAKLSALDLAYILIIS